ncbi:hypothetical protein CYMTET_47600 [Cymbomonas tetramitiformis]|uniref:Uncharacterized protein n=1 Tax=Cymbomonas tetramitiformis TaxID=36881 RepID=A0AAE0BVF0_9CHLO|nr:hypothetical protein CYMTET_47600 [Cymbomonas tetramitiformis]
MLDRLHSGKYCIPDLIREEDCPEHGSLVDRWGDLKIRRLGVPRRGTYIPDLFHTLLNVRHWRFFLIIIVVYLSQFLAFAGVYTGIIYSHIESSQDTCIAGMDTYLQAIWFSVQTSMTIGYGKLSPSSKPHCTLINSFIAMQAVISLLIDYALLGCLYARISRPTARGRTIVFSPGLTCHQGGRGMWWLTFSVANLRKHTILQPEVRAILAIEWTRRGNNEDEGSAYRFLELDLEAEDGGKPTGFLGLPLNIRHLITKESPLYGLSVMDMEQKGMEILVMLDGIDASTSCNIQGRRSYFPRDIQFHQRLKRVVTRSPQDGTWEVNFQNFGKTYWVEALAANTPRSGDWQIGNSHQLPADAPPLPFPVPSDPMLRGYDRAGSPPRRPSSNVRGAQSYIGTPKYLAGEPHEGNQIARRESDTSAVRLQEFHVDQGALRKDGNTLQSRPRANSWMHDQTGSGSSEHIRKLSWLDEKETMAAQVALQSDVAESPSRSEDSSSKDLNVLVGLIQEARHATKAADMRLQYLANMIISDSNCPPHLIQRVQEAVTLDTSISSLPLKDVEV